MSTCVCARVFVCLCARMRVCVCVCVSVCVCVCVCVCHYSDSGLVYELNTYVCIQIKRTNSIPTLWACIKTPYTYVRIEKKKSITRLWACIKTNTYVCHTHRTNKIPHKQNTRTNKIPVTAQTLGVYKDTIDKIREW